MAKFYGAVGFVEYVETAPGVRTEVVTERNYAGDLTRITRQLNHSEHLFDSIEMNNMISVIADPYAFQHFFAIRYLKWQGVCWNVTSVEVQQPRLLLMIGGMYHV